MSDGNDVGGADQELISMTPPTGLAVDVSAEARNVLEHTVKSVLGSQPRVPMTIEVVQGRPALTLDPACPVVVVRPPGSRDTPLA